MNQTEHKQSTVDLNRLVEAICALPSDFHEAGVMSPVVLRMMLRLMRNMDIRHTAETGSGKTTLLFSHLSPHHTVFAKDRFGNFDVRSISSVQDSELFNTQSTHFVVGATQQTLPHHEFKHPLDAVLIDGPHGYPFPELEYYYFYPHLREGGLLFLDDIHIPTIWRTFEFLREESMFELVEISGFTAAFRRTKEACFDPYGDGWWLQGFNANRRAQAKAVAEKTIQELTGSATADEALPSVEQNDNAKPGIKYYVYRVLVAMGGETFARRVRSAYQAFKAAG